MNYCLYCFSPAFKELENSPIFQAASSNLEKIIERQIDRQLVAYTSNITIVITDYLIKSSSNV